MKYLLMFLISSNAVAQDIAKVELIYKNTTKEKQIIVLEKSEGKILCKVSNQPSRKLSTPKLKSLDFPLKEMKSVESCENIIVWNYKNKKSKSCYFLDQDFVVNDIIFECYN